MTTTSDTPPTPPRLPRPRVIAALAAGMLALGAAIGAAIGPAPSASLAGERIPQLLPSILALAAPADDAHPSTPPIVQPPPVTRAETPTATPETARAGRTGATAKRLPTSTAPSAKSVSPTAPNSSSPSSPSPSTAPTKKGGGRTTLPPVTSVWLITLSGAHFAQALAQPAAAPYIDTQLLPAGALLSGWSSLAASAFAGEAALLGGAPPQTLDTIVQPPCPEGAAGAPCAPETAGALSAADEFLKATVPSITSSVAYREHGLIVITFGTVANATASSLPAGASTATLDTQPPAGVLLLSPFVRPGVRSATAFNPTSPKQSLSELLR